MSTRVPTLPFGVQRSIQKEKARKGHGDGVRATLVNFAMKVGQVFSVVPDSRHAVPASRSISTTGRCRSTASDDDGDVLPYKSKSQPATDVCRLLRGDAEAVWHFQVNYPHLLHLEQEVGALHGSRPLTATQAEERWHMVDWIIRYHQEFELSHLTLFLAVQILDRSLAICWVPPEKSRKIAATALLLASKFQDERYPDHIGLAQFGDGQFVAEELHLAELDVLLQLEHRFHDPTVAHHLFWFLKLCDCDVTEDDDQYNLVLYLADLGLYLPEARGWTPTQYAAAVVFLSNLLLSKTSWPPAFDKVAVGGEERRREAVRSIAGDLLRVLGKSEPGHAAYDKHEEELKVASSAVRFAEKSMGRNWCPVQKN